MRLSTKARYAVRAMVDLAIYSNGRPVTLKEIAGREEIPLSYLEQLFFRLKCVRLVESVRGPGGGYLLARDGSEITVGEIIAGVEEQLNPVACLDSGAAECSRMPACVTYSVWKGLGERIHSFLDSIRLADLAADARQRMEAGADRLGSETSAS
ncbi:MAG: Rrf2 family transcriptional regulator [Geobacter sp.]|nr:Rrf2 family transcriptional regulator [Geobacter sp.]